MLPPAPNTHTPHSSQLRGAVSLKPWSISPTPSRPKLRNGLHILPILPCPTPPHPFPEMAGSAVGTQATSPLTCCGLGSQSPQYQQRRQQPSAQAQGAPGRQPRTAPGRRFSPSLSSLTVATNPQNCQACSHWKCPDRLEALGSPVPEASNLHLWSQPRPSPLGHAPHRSASRLR